jgi:phosphoribosyl-ATP pyrophosphohydrolase
LPDAKEINIFKQLFLALMILIWWSEWRSVMDFERYYLDLFEMLNSCCKKIASGKYDKEDSEHLFELSKKERYPGVLSELAESFGMMMVKVEAREFKLKQIIKELEQAKAEPPEDSGGKGRDWTRK